MRGKPSLLWHAPSSRTVGKQQLVILQPSCPYPFAMHGTRLVAQTSLLPLLTMGFLGSGCPDTSVLSGIEAV